VLPQRRRGGAFVPLRYEERARGGRFGGGFFTARKDGFLIPGAAGLLRQAEAFCSAVDPVQDSRLPGQNLALRGEISAGFEVSFLQRRALPCQESRRDGG
jgi:hypothetical protein